MRRVFFFFYFFFLRTSSAWGGGGGAARLFFFFPCSADHERGWPRCKVVFFGLATNALNVRNNNNNNNNIGPTTIQLNAVLLGESTTEKTQEFLYYCISSSNIPELGRNLVLS